MAAPSNTGAVRLRCQCGRACVRRAGTSVQNRGKFYLSCANAEVPNAHYCGVLVWEHDLEAYVNRRFASIVDESDMHKQRHEEVKNDYFDTLDELEGAKQENRRLKKLNKVLQLSLAATAPVAATIAVAAAWVAK